MQKHEFLFILLSTARRRVTCVSFDVLDFWSPLSAASPNRNVILTHGLPGALGTSGLGFVASASQQSEKNAEGKGNDWRETIGGKPQT